MSASKKTGKKRHKKNKHHEGNLHGLPANLTKHIEKIPGYVGQGKTAIQLASIAGGVALGRILFPSYSPFIGAGIGLVGLGLGNQYISSFGMGCVLSPNTGFTGTNGVDDGVDGISMDVIKDRAKVLVDTFKDKFSFPKKDNTDNAGGGTNGLNGNDKATYFVNPMKNGDLDLSELDKISNQIAQMNGLLNEVDPIERNF